MLEAFQQYFKDLIDSNKILDQVNRKSCLTKSPFSPPSPSAPGAPYIKKKRHTVSLQI